MLFKIKKMSANIVTQAELKKYLKKLKKMDIAIDPSIYKKYLEFEEMLEKKNT